MVSLAEPRKYFPEETGLSTTIPDATLGGTFTFSAGSAVDWTPRIMYSLSYVTFAPLAAAADTTPPVLSLPADKTVEATGPTGAVVSFTATATDDVDPSPTVSCTPPSGSIFPLGKTTVSCTATDASGNSATGSFTITVVDTTPPTLTLPANKVVDATGPRGAAVSYTVAATDTVDASPAVICSPPSGSVFAIGTTTVRCTATDASGNAATATFTVHVEGAAEQLADLAAAVKGVGPGKSLAATVEIAQWLLVHGQPRLTCLTLTTFDLEVRAQSGKKIPAPQATALIADANRIKSVLGCTK
jgi:HYR domain